MEIFYQVTKQEICDTCIGMTGTYFPAFFYDDIKEKIKEAAETAIEDFIRSIADGG